MTSLLAEILLVLLLLALLGGAGLWLAHESGVSDESKET
jgi:hypothetical protein